MNNKSLLFIVCFLSIFIFIINNVSASIGVSPTKTYLSLKTEAQNCTQIYFFPDENTKIDDQWAKERGASSETYTLSKEDLGIKINLTRKDYGKYEFCFKANNPGHFYGLIFFQPKNSLTRIGTWIELDVESETIMEKIYLITGSAIAANHEYRFDLIAVLLLLVVIFVLLIRKIFLKQSSPSLN